MKSRDITVHIGNYNGMRNNLVGKSRIYLTIESLLNCFPHILDTDVRLIDNFSDDGSWDYIQSIPFGKKRRFKRIETNIPWLTTTVNNMANLKNSIIQSDKKYFWNIENDSFFYGNDSFIDKSIEVLETNSDISIVHLKRWTPICAHNSPGVPTNLSRYSEIRSATSGFDFFVLEKRPEYSLWVRIEFDLEKDFIPDEEAGYGKCPLGINQIGALRLNEEGKYERLLTEHWNSYTSHGWIGRREDLVFLISKYNPLGERQMSRAFKKQFRAAKLDEDAFVDFGWNLRIHPAELEISKVFEEVKKGGSSISEFGIYRPKFEAGGIEIEEKKVNVYK